METVLGLGIAGVFIYLIWQVGYWCGACAKGGLVDDHRRMCRRLLESKGWTKQLYCDGDYFKLHDKDMAHDLPQAMIAEAARGR
jgi:hypothetical protein